jgi:hypothetical protein
VASVSTAISTKTPSSIEDDQLAKASLGCENPRVNAVDGDDNWLNGQQLRCPECGEELYLIDHSPFYDGYYLYCDRCPKRVDVSIYDPVMRDAPSVSYSELMAWIECRLRPCDCGGSFRHDAPRRCHQCGTVLSGVDPADGVDVWPGDGSMFHPGNEAAMDAFAARFIRGSASGTPAELWT